MTATLHGDEAPGVRGNTRKPKFGEWMRGVWASERNPQRDGMYVKTVRRTGRLNPGTWFELTDGKGNFYQYESSQTVFIEQPPQAPNADAIREIIEIYAGMDGFDPETAAEAYALRIIKQMYEVAANAVRT